MDSMKEIKSEICRFFQNGFCQKGTACLFVHDAVSQQSDENSQYILHDVLVSESLVEVAPTTVCSFFLRGKCSRSNCPYPHVVTETKQDAGPEEVPLPPPQETAVLEIMRSDERVVIGQTRCVFGAGAEVLEVITGSRSLDVQTTRLGNNANEVTIRRALERHGELASFEFKQTADGYCLVKAAYTSLAVTLAAIDALKDTMFAIELVSDAARRKKVLSESVSQSRSLKVQWFESDLASIAYAHFPHRANAERAARLCDGKNISGCVLSCSFQEPSYKQR
jgi:hypothetical protein